jgi:hypothetical protein
MGLVPCRSGGKSPASQRRTGQFTRTCLAPRAGYISGPLQYDYGAERVGIRRKEFWPVNQIHKVGSAQHTSHLAHTHSLLRS